MSALLRQGARRIGGSVLQRTQAAVTSPAVAEERRRLVPRRMYSAQEHTREAIKDVKHMKEELYQVLCKDGNMGERGLLQDLAVDVNPGPQDTRWRGLRVARRVGNFVETTGTILFASLVIVVYSVYESYEAAAKREMQKQARVEELLMEKQA